MGKARTTWKQLLEEEAEARISRMEAPGYPFPRRFSRGDWLVWALVTAGSLLLLLLGAGL